MAEQPSRAEVLNNLHLKTFVKEHHAQPLRHLVFNTMDADKSNLFATVAHNQATIYDNQHFGSYIAVVEQFVNAKTDYTDGGDLLAVAWLSSAGTPQIHGDGLLAVGGTDMTVSVISMASASVVALLKGHTSDVIDLTATSAKPHLLASVSKDGTVRVWNVKTEACVASLASPAATTAAFRADGAALLVGTSSGAIHEWKLPVQALAPDAAAATTAAPSSDATAFPTSPVGHGCRIDSVVALPGGRFASKSGDGRVIVWVVATKAQAAAFRVPGCTPGSSRGRLGSTPDGCVLLAGGAPGELHAFDSATGSKLGTLSTGKVRAPVLACAATDDCSTVLGIAGPGWVARWETIVAGAAAEAAEDGDD